MEEKTDRELLELAAKAAGIDLAWDGVGLQSPRKKTDWNYWNPLTSDGDALRLAIVLNIEIGWEAGGAVVFADNCSEPAEENPAASTRRAIVRAAAELAGKGAE